MYGGFFLDRVLARILLLRVAKAVKVVCEFSNFEDGVGVPCC